MASVMDFLAMGGYAGYVWPAYGVTGLLLLAMLAWSLAAYRRCQRALERLQRDAPP